MYRGIARLPGMKVADCSPDFDSEIDALQAAWSHHDFLFLHFKDTDNRGEDGDFDGKVKTPHYPGAGPRRPTAKIRSLRAGADLGRSF